VSVGRLHPQKMLDDLVRMLAHLKGMDGGLRGVTLTLIGDGPERERLEGLAAELGVRDSVVFAGQVRNEDLPRHLVTHDAFVSPNTGTALREAALCGLPLLAYDIDWIHGFLKHDETALLAPRGDYEELARQAARLAADPDLRRKLSENSRQLAARLFTPESLRASLEEAFGEDLAPEEP